MKETRKRIGVVLFQLGGPDSLDALRPFLTNLFRDPEIVDFPFLPNAAGGLVRRGLAWWIARSRASRRGGKAEAYAAIGGRSPIRLLTERQAQALEEALSRNSGMDAKVVVAMRYWHPFTAEAVAELFPAGGTPLDELVLLPLYPQYSRATTGSSLKEWWRCCESRDIGIPPVVHVVEHFYDHPGYIEALVERINLSLAHFARPNRPVGALLAAPDVHLVFSAHGLPMSFVERGDPYPQQVEATVQQVMARGGWLAPNVSTGTNPPARRSGAGERGGTVMDKERSGTPRQADVVGHALCYQSKVGRQRWLEPSLHETIERLAREGVKRILVVPVSFVTEHIETLHEINIETREEARRLGIEQFEMMPALNDSPRFITALADLVRQAVHYA